MQERIFQIALILAGAGGLTLAVFLSLRTSPSLTTLGWMPRWLANWCSHHGVLQNFPAFALIALPFLLAVRGNRARLRLMGFLALLPVVLELWQRFIPTRYASVVDVLCSWAGMLVAWGVIETIRICLSVWRVNLPLCGTPNRKLIVEG